MLLDRIDKESADISRVVLDMTWWLDEGELLTDILEQEVIQGMAGWSEAPYPPRDTPPPYDPTPLLLLSATFDAFSKDLITFVQHGTAGVAYTCQFLLRGTSGREVTVELGVQVVGVPPAEPMPLPPPPSEAAGSGPQQWYLNIAGGTMRGPLYLVEEPKYPTEAVTKHYVDGMSWVGGPFMAEVGGTFTGPVTMTDTLTLAPADPTDPHGATSKQYVDGRVASAGAAYLPLAGGVLTGSLQFGAGGPLIRAGIGAPSVSAPAGSLYLRTDGTAGNRVYVNQNGVTVWTPIPGV